MAMTGRWIVSAVAMFGTALSPARAQEPVEAFAVLPRYDAPALSPNGERVVVRVAVKGEQLVASLGLFDGKPAAVIPLGDYEPLGWHWVNDDWLTVTVGKNFRFRAQQAYFVRLVGVPRDGHKIIPLGWDKGGFAHQLLWTAAMKARASCCGARPMSTTIWACPMLPKPMSRPARFIRSSVRVNPSFNIMRTGKAWSARGSATRPTPSSDG